MSTWEKAALWVAAVALTLYVAYDWTHPRRLSEHYREHRQLDTCTLCRDGLVQQSQGR